GLPRSARPGDELAIGDVVTTGSDGAATLRFLDGRALELGASGRYEVGRDDAGLVVHLGEGTIVSRVPDTAEGVELSIQTPYGLVRVGRAALTLAVNGDVTTLDVLAGDVRILSRGGETVQLSIGDHVTLTRLGVSKRVREVKLEALVVLLGDVAGQVEVRRKTSATFTRVSAATPPALSEGDVLRVTRGAATLHPPGAGDIIALSPNAEVAVGEVTATELALDVRRGGLNVAVPAGAARRLHPGDGYTLAIDEGAQFDVTRTAAGLEVHATTGAVRVEHGGRAVGELHSAQRAVLSRAGALNLSALDREPVVLPSRLGLTLFHPNLGRAAISWPGDDEGLYDVTVASEPSFRKPLIAGVVRQPWLNVPVPARGSLHWKVSAGGVEVAKGTVSCSPERSDAELRHARNDVLEGPEKTVIYFQDKPPAVTFRWREADGGVGASYRLQVFAATALESALEERVVQTTTVRLPENALGEGSYLWSVAQLDAAGRPLAGGRMNKLELIYDNAVSELLITSPRNGARLTSSVPVVGVAPLNSALWVNGVPLTLDDKARFNASAKPVAGRVVFRMMGRGGEQYTVRVLARGT
ncbi:MAG: FecR domain-containing protein, partial [Archangium sp.]|nr:FecR domain-containing protein [Archangium sp.]